MQIIDIHMGVSAAVNDALARAVAIGGLIAIALIHMLELPDAMAAIGYIGGLFIAAVVACLAVAAVLTRTSDDRAWAAAGGLATVILLGYIVSRWVGLPGFTDDVGDWSERLGLASMVAEGLVVCVVGAMLGTRHVPALRRPAASAAATGMQPGPAVG
jgi:hypothetical protein